MRYVAVLLLACGSGDPMPEKTADGGQECKYTVAVRDLEQTRMRCANWAGYDFVDFEGRHVIYVCIDK